MIWFWWTKSFSIMKILIKTINITDLDNDDDDDDDEMAVINKK